MTDEDESTDSGIIAAERAILKFLRGREANAAAREDRGMSAVSKIRTHRSLDKDAPIWRPVQRTGVITSNPILGGLHHHCIRI